MARIVHLSDLPYLITYMEDLLCDSHEVVSCRFVEAAEHVEGKVDLYICGAMGKHSDGLLFAIDKQREGKRVLIVEHRRKFSRLPFLSLSELANKELVRRTVEAMIKAGG